MGLKVSALLAARLANRSQRTITRWIETGQLAATPVGARTPKEHTGPSRWEIDVDDLAQMPNVTIDQSLLAEVEAQQAVLRQGTSVLERLEQLERAMEALQTEVRELREGRGSSS